MPHTHTHANSATIQARPEVESALIDSTDVKDHRSRSTAFNNVFILPTIGITHIHTASKIQQQI